MQRGGSASLHYLRLELEARRLRPRRLLCASAKAKEDGSRSAPDVEPHDGGAVLGDHPAELQAVVDRTAVDLEEEVAFAQAHAVCISPEIHGGDPHAVPVRGARGVEVLDAEAERFQVLAYQRKRRLRFCRLAGFGYQRDSHLS